MRPDATWPTVPSSRGGWDAEEYSAVRILGLRQLSRNYCIRWLFPGQSGLRSAPPTAIVTQLNRHGIYIRAGRTAALIDLAGQLPPAVLASLLGLAPVTAERWSRRIASDWATYLHARTRALSE